MAPWDKLGQAANLMQLTGVDAFGLVSMIVQAAHTARRNRDLCQQLAQKVQIVGSLLGELQIPELRRHPETRLPLDKLDEALFRACKLVRSCSQQQRSRSQLLQMLMGDDVATKLRHAKEEIDSYIILIPMITAVAAVKSRGTQEVTEDETAYPDPAQRLRLSPQEVTQLLTLEELQPEVTSTTGATQIMEFPSTTGAAQIMEFPEWLRSFSHKELWQATDGFSVENEMMGDFRGCYRGLLLRDEGLHVVIKRVDYKGEPRTKSMIVWSISRLRHPNLVQPVGWCCDEAYQEVLLVYELFSNYCSLDNHLHDSINTLTWPIRYKIILGMCDALFYWHQGSSVELGHGALRPSNVILDSSFNVKLGAPELAMLNGNGYVPPDAQGRMAYTDPTPRPEYWNNVKADIYSFGVILLEIACGRRPMICPRGEEEEEENFGNPAEVAEESNSVPLVKWVRGLYHREVLLDAVDPRLNGHFEAREMERVLLVGLWCAHPRSCSRPTIDQVMKGLSDLKEPLPDLPPAVTMRDHNHRHISEDVERVVVIMHGDDFPTFLNSARDL